MTCLVDEDMRMDLALRYMGEEPSLDRDEIELLLFALYLESKEHGGLMAQAEKKCAEIDAARRRAGA